MLDERAENIKNELDEARALRQEAMDLLADYEKRAKEAEQEASALVKQAEEDAKRIAAEVEIALQERLERRTVQAEEKLRELKRNYRKKSGVQPLIWPSMQQRR